MNAPTRPEIEQNFAGWIRWLEFREKHKKKDGTPKRLLGIVYVQNPYGKGEPQQ